MSALNTDLYQLTMAAGYFAAGKTNEIATFELSVRRLPEHRNFLVSAGLQQAIEYLQGLQFRQEEIEYLRSLKQFEQASPEFFSFLQLLGFTGDVFALPEGTPVFANEPILIVRAPLVEAQLVETYLLSTIAFETTVASKAARCVFAAEGRPVIEFGSRRAHSPEAGVLAGRAAYLAGCEGTSNAEAGMMFDIPVFGTAAHSWTMAFADEMQSFKVLQEVLGQESTFLLDTYDTIEGAHEVVQLGRPLWGVRLDSGDIEVLSRQVRKILDKGGLTDAKIFVTNELNEDKISELVRQQAPIDAFGVGTQLATSADAPALSAVYKLVELEHGDSHTYTAKYSTDKVTLPGAKQIYRHPDHDVVTLYNECNSNYKGEPLVRPVMMQGQLVEQLPTTKAIRAYRELAVERLPERLKVLEAAEPYSVEVGERLRLLADSVRSDRQMVKS